MPHRCIYLFQEVRLCKGADKQGAREGDVGVKEGHSKDGECSKGMNTQGDSIILPRRASTWYVSRCRRKTKWVEALCWVLWEHQNGQMNTGFQKGSTPARQLGCFTIQWQYCQKVVDSVAEVEIYKLPTGVSAGGVRLHFQWFPGFLIGHQLGERRRIFCLKFVDFPKEIK